MSPTSYQTAPPRIVMIATTSAGVKPAVSCWNRGEPGGPPAAEGRHGRNVDRLRRNTSIQSMPLTIQGMSMHCHNRLDK